MVGTMLTAELNNLLDATVNKLNKTAGVDSTAHVRRDIDKDTTHIIAASKPHGSRRCARTMKFFKGVAMGLWVVTPAWLQACHDAGQWLPADDYEVLCGEHDKPPSSSSNSRRRRGGGSGSGSDDGGGGGGGEGGPTRSRLAHESTEWDRPGGITNLLENVTLCMLGNYPSISLKMWDLKQLAMMAGARVVAAPKRRNENDSSSSGSSSSSSSTSSSLSCDFVLCPKNTTTASAKSISSQTGLPVVGHHWLLDSIGYWRNMDPLSKKWLLSNWVPSSRNDHRSKIASP